MILAWEMGVEEKQYVLSNPDRQKGKKCQGLVQTIEPQIIAKIYYKCRWLIQVSVGLLA